MGVIMFNGVGSDSYGIQVEHPPEYETPERDYTVTSIPGRNGDLVKDNGSYKNVPRVYQIAIGDLEEGFDVLSNRISRWLHSCSGYAKLEDSYEPEYYRIAMYSDGNTISNIHQHAGRTSISFNCKPQRFLKYGDSKRVFLANGQLFNPTEQVSLPIITVRGSGAGTLTIGEHVISISSITDGMVINSEIQDSYFMTNNLNSRITLNKGFPKLKPSKNTITFTGGITSLEIVPKWWTV